MMEISTILAIVAIVAAVGVMGASTAILSQQANADSTNCFQSGTTGFCKSSSDTSFQNAKAHNVHNHIKRP